MKTAYRSHSSPFIESSNPAGSYCFFYILQNFRMWFKYGLKAQKLLAQGIALGNYGRKPVAL